MLSCDQGEPPVAAPAAKVVEPNLQDLDVVHITQLPISMKIAALAFVGDKDHTPAGCFVETN